MAKSTTQRSGVILVVGLLLVLPGSYAIPAPQVNPGQIPPHIASHPALRAVTNDKESALIQYAYNTQNRRGPNPSALVLQSQTGEANLALVNQLQTARNGGQAYIPGSPGSAANAHLQNGHGHSHGHAHGQENPELRALELLNKYKGQSSPAPGPNSYDPVALKPDQLRYPPQGHGLPPQGPGHVHGHGIPPDHGIEAEGEDIRKLKSLLNLPPGAHPAQGHSQHQHGHGTPVPPSPSFGTGPPPHGHGSPTIGVAGERGLITPGAGHHGHDPHQHHHHDRGYTPTPFPATAQTQYSTRPYGQSSPPPGYPGAGGPTSAPNAPYYGSGGRDQGYQPYPTPYPNPPHSHGHDHSHEHPHQHHGQGQAARTLIQSVNTPEDAYNSLLYIDPIRDPNSINKHVDPGQSVFILPASDYTSDDFQRLLNRPAEILIDVLPTDGHQEGKDLSLHNFSLLLTPSTYARCAQATYKKGYGGKCKLILKVGKKSGPFSGTRQPVQVSY